MTLLNDEKVIIYIKKNHNLFIFNCAILGKIMALKKRSRLTHFITARTRRYKFSINNLQILAILE